MPSAEFKFYLLLPLLLGLAWVWPHLGSAVFRSMEQWLDRLAARPWRALVLVGVVAFAASVVPALLRPPTPKVHDEFCYLLTADTLAHGRLTNPTPALWEHFESMNVIQHPTYNSKYPPGQAAFLALGQILWRPILGNWLGIALGCMAVCWMLQAWLPGKWALAGGILMALHPQVIAWGYNYWGGAVAMMGGALLCGGLRRLAETAKSGAWASGLGLLLLAHTRPYEGLVFSLLTTFGVGLAVLRLPSEKQRQLVRASWRPFLISSAIIVGSVALYNARVTGHPLRMPYVEHREQYAVVPLFAWQQIRPEPVYRHPEIRAMYQEEITLCWGHDGLAPSMARKLAGQIQGWWWLGLWLPPFAAVLWSGWRDRWVRTALLCLGAFLLALLTSQGVFAHYAAPGAALLVFCVMAGFRYLWTWQPARGVGRAFARWLCVLSVVSVPVVWSRLVEKNATGWFRERERIIQELSAQPGRHLVVVRYTPDHNPNREWVYNGADLEGAGILWARSMGEVKDQELIAQYRGRTVWLLEADGAQSQVVPYPPVLPQVR